MYLILLFIDNNLFHDPTDCGGVTYEPKSRNYTLRKGKTLKRSPSHEVTYIKHFASTSSKTSRGRFITRNLVSFTIIMSSSSDIAKRSISF